MLVVLLTLNVQNVQVVYNATREIILSLYTRWCFSISKHSVFFLEVDDNFKLYNSMHL